MGTPTWKTNKIQVSEVKVKSTIDRDIVQFLQNIRDKQLQGKELIKVAPG